MRLGGKSVTVYVSLQLDNTTCNFSFVNLLYGLEYCNKLNFDSIIITVAS